MPRVYVVLHPKDMDAENPVNYHVIEAFQDAVTEELSFPSDWKALDGKFTMRPDAYIVPSQVMPHDDDVMRSALARKQNAGKPICGNCARHFYADPKKP